MATIKAFKGLRYNTNESMDIKTLLCPPYDIVSSEEREQLVNSNKYNMITLELPSGENKYENASMLLNEYIENQILVSDNEDSIYIYEEEFTAYNTTKNIKGFISLVELCEFSEKVVLPHEETLSKAKTDRFNLMSTTFCNFSQIYSLYIDDNNATTKTLNDCSNKKPDIEVTTDDGIIHRFWAITDETVINSIKNQFKDRQLYIADGHHRYETALNFRKKLKEEGTLEGTNADFVMMMLVSMENDGLVVFPTHRMIKGLDNFSEEAVLEKISNYFTVEKIDNIVNIEEELAVLSNNKAFAFYTGKDYYLKLVLKDNNAVSNIVRDKSSAYCNLDVTVLHTLILETCFGIDKENMANQTNLNYTRSIKEAIEKTKTDEYQCSFILNPTKVSEIRDVALANEKMPQKSTYFYPKIITGLVINKLK